MYSRGVKTLAPKGQIWPQADFIWLPCNSAFKSTFHSGTLKDNIAKHFRIPPRTPALPPITWETCHLAICPKSLDTPNVQGLLSTMVKNPSCYLSLEDRNCPLTVFD